jgi:hypothetical protein
MLSASPPVVEEVAQQPSRNLARRGWNLPERPPQPPLLSAFPAVLMLSASPPVVEEVAQQPSRNLARRGWDPPERLLDHPADFRSKRPLDSS